MFSVSFQFIAVVCSLFIILRKGYCSEENEISYYSQNETNDIVEQRPSSSNWFKSAQDMFVGPAGHVVVQIAKELLNRSAGNSQVLSLNLTNLLIILLLKILIFAGGLLGAGHWSNYERARSYEDASALSIGEAHLITGFLVAQGSGYDECLFQAACQFPTAGYEYARAAKALLQGIEKYEGTQQSHLRYNDLISLVEKASHEGFRGSQCDSVYKCGIPI